MDLLDAARIVDALAGRLDPVTGEPLGEDGPFGSPQIMAALQAASAALREQAASREWMARKTPLPSNAGKSWEADEEQSLGREFDAGMKIPEMAALHRRTQGSIRARLVRLGKIQV